MTEECCVCKQPIKGDCIESGKKFYHPLCMRCFVCGDALRGQYFTFEGEPICERDYKVRHLIITVIKIQKKTCNLNFGNSVGINDYDIHPFSSISNGL